MHVTLTDEAQRYARRFAEVTGVTPRDLLVLEPDDSTATGDDAQGGDQRVDPAADSRRGGYDAATGDHVGGASETRLVVVVPAGRKGEAVGPQGATVERAEGVLDARIDLIEHAESPARFVANTLAPAAVRDVTVSEMGVAFAEVLDADRGVAIGTDGENIEVARRLARRHFEIDDVQLA